MPLDRCAVCDHPLWPGQTILRRSDTGRIHRRCRTAATEQAKYMLVTEAATLKGLSREGMRKIVRAGYLPAYCQLCLSVLTPDTLQSGTHDCPADPKHQLHRYHVVLKRVDVDAYVVNPANQESGRLGGLARAAAEKEDA
jgi:hypothetical protein